jgi:hypothetical protein
MRVWEQAQPSMCPVSSVPFPTRQVGSSSRPLAKAFVGLSPGGLCRDNIAGIKAQVVANQIWQPATGDDWTPAKTGPMWWPPGNGPPPSANPIPSTPVVPAVSVPVVPVPQASTTVVANSGPPAADGCTVKGQWLCKGLALMQCDAVTSTTFGEWTSFGAPI